MSKFIKLLGKSAKVKILEFFLRNPNSIFTKTDIVRGSCVGRAQLYRYLDELLMEGIIVRGEKIGRIGTYRLNLENDVTKALLLLVEKKLL